MDDLDARPRTIEGYRYRLERHLLPRFARRKLTDISTDDVARLVVEMKRAGYAGWTTNSVLTTLSSMMRKAERRGLIGSNPVRGLERDERPAVEQAEKRILDEAELGKLLAGTGGYRPLIALLAFSGLRLGEALGLTWSDIAFPEGFIRVRAQLSRQRERVESKTAGSRREVVLVPQLALTLREHRMASRYKGETDFVFPAPDGRGRLHSVAARGIERAVTNAGLEGVTPHTFRHGFASMLIVGLKLDPVNVARQLGHADPSITLRVYSHLFERARAADEMRQKLGDGFGHLLASRPS